MNLFDEFVTKSIQNKPEFSHLRAVVEKEILHHDILLIMSQNGFMKNLTFVGGTALRLCYGGIRLSEDLDFSADCESSHSELNCLTEAIKRSIFQKYGFDVAITEPKKDEQNVKTWKIKIETSKNTKDSPKQRINLDICSIASDTKQPMIIKNHYGINFGTSGLVLSVISQEELFTDKLVAFALRPNRLKYRDLWDIMWLHQNGIEPKLELISSKVTARNFTYEEFLSRFSDRCDSLVTESDNLMKEFCKEMERFLPGNEFSQFKNGGLIFQAIANLMNGFKNQFN